MNKLRCQVCSYEWTPKTANPARCGRYACRSMLWDGRERQAPGFKHGFTKTATYRTWQNMKNRCDAPNNPRWRDYGGAGVSYEPRWADFQNFLEDMGERPKGTSLDRYPDPWGNYSKDNCRWATPKQQQNNMRNNRRITYQGETLTMAEWAQRLGIKQSTLRARLKRNWTIERAFSTVLG